VVLRVEVVDEVTKADLPALVAPPQIPPPAQPAVSQPHGGGARQQEPPSNEGGAVGHSSAHGGVGTGW
jgi:hypothetical protein